MGHLGAFPEHKSISYLGFGRIVSDVGSNGAEVLRAAYQTIMVVLLPEGIQITQPVSMNEAA
jgi:hypothetical protein